MRLNLWMRLPMHMIEYVLLKLPFENFVGLRVVCKDWNSFIISCGGSHPRPSPRNVLLSVAAGEASITSFSRKVQAWHDVPLSFLGVDASQFRLVASDGGLLCFQKKNESGEFAICNPLTKRWKQLPPLDRQELSEGVIVWDAAGISTEKNGRSYKLIVVGYFKNESNQNEERSCSEVTQIYQSTAGCWTKGTVPSITARGHLMSLPRGKVASSSGCLYTMLCHKKNDWSLLKYEAQHKLWSSIAAPEGISHPDVFENKGRVYLVAQCSDAILGPELIIWELNEEETGWSQGKSIFRDLCVVFSQMQDPPLGSSSHCNGDNTPCVCVCMGHGPSLFVIGRDSAGCVMVWTHDTGTEKWGHLPRVKHENFIPQMACMFQPSLGALV